MKIIEGMKEVTRLEESIEDLRDKVSKYCADMENESAVYPDQKKQVSEWLQSIHDRLKEAMRLRICVQHTNLATPVTIELGGQKVVHSIAEWILRRRIYAEQERKGWAALTDRNLRDTAVKASSGEQTTVRVRRYFDPLERDKKVEEYRSEPSIVDRTLEVVNATTELVQE